MSLLNHFRTITTFVFDVDGVLTDGSILVMEDGQQARRMSIRDGYILQLAVKKGYRIVIISGANSSAVKLRLEKLGITEIHMAVSDKAELLNRYREQHGLEWTEILFMGDDIPDLEVMKLCGLPCTPSDGVPEIKSIARYVSPVAGGQGCVRDVMEKVLKLRGHWSSDVTVASK